jgi:hypothetical protein
MTTLEQINATCNGCDAYGETDERGYCAECASEMEPASMTILDTPTFHSEQRGGYTIVAEQVTLPDGTSWWWWETIRADGNGPSYGDYVTTKLSAITAGRENARKRAEWEA